MAAAAHAYSVCLLGNLLDFGVASADDGGASTVCEIPLHADAPVVQVGCGLDWVCLLASSGSVYSCGRNTYGQLGQGLAALAGSDDAQHRPAPLVPRPLHLPPGARVARISSGTAHGGFVTERGALFMFGCSSYGRLGTGTGSASSSAARRLGDQFSPVQVRMTWSALLAKAATLSAAVRCGIPVVLPRLEPAALASGDSARARPETDKSDAVDKDDEVVFVDISCGDRHTVVLGGRAPDADTGGAITISGLLKTSVISFGDGMNGRLGTGSEFDQSTGALVTTFKAVRYAKGPVPKITAISAGDAHNAALTASGELFTWGTGADGQLGHGGCGSEWAPRQVGFFETVALAAVKCGARHTLAVTRTGAVYTWGRGLEGQLGTGAPAMASATLPQRVHLAVDPLAVHQMAIDAQIHAVAAASSLPSASSSDAAAAPGASLALALAQQQQLLQQQDLHVTVRAIAARANVCMALDEHARLFSWGCNSDQQLGFAPSEGETVSRRRSEQRSRDTRSGADDSAEVRSHLPAAAAVLAPRQLLHAKLLAASARGEQLVHFEASDRFTMLVFKADATDGGARQQGERATGVSGAESGASEGAPRDAANSKWQLSLQHELRADDVPSKESAYFRLMVNYKPTSPPRRVRGTESWLEKRSPTKPRAQRAFGVAERFPQSSAVDRKSNNNAKADEVQQPATAAPSAPKAKAKPARAASASAANRLGRALRHRLELQERALCGGARGFGVQPTPAAFGSSAKSRFAADALLRSTVDAATPLHPEMSTPLVFATSPRFSMGSGEHYSMMIARRLTHARGPMPGPGTYDRRGG
ncbi:hypothetical protein PybrP1_000661 [[Pythium] brassicae (nom. inval.)]|nr:hypothetical protein PybrP1_000661 [[Pythium] brassicae (nom. inval.)]